ncbi:hypothetical protein BKI52_31605 [marine bacterium AO1-C]|nr:hypothetical protein BKI52_31605 [marine bacterium AO1-C]
MNSAQAQNFSYLKHYTTDDGLPHSVGYSLMQDSKGYLWVCTDDGLARFDGKTFKVYRSKDGLLSNYPIDVAEAKDGTLWVGTWKGGTNYIRNDSIFTANIDNPLFRISNIEINGDKLILSNETKNTLFYQKKGDQWKLLSNPKKPRLALRKDVSPTYIQLKDFDTTKYFKVLNYPKTYLTHDQRMLIFGGLSGVWQYQRDSTFTPLFPEIIQKDSVFHVMQDAQQNYWMGGHGKIFKISPQGQAEIINQNLPLNDIYDIQHGIDGKIYFLTSFIDLNQRGLYSYDPATRELINLKKLYDLQALPIDLEVDREGNVWFTTSGDGVYCITYSPFENYAQNQGLDNTQITHLVQDGGGHMYVGTINGLYHFQDKGLERIKLTAQQASTEIQAMYPTQQGSIEVFFHSKNIAIGGSIEIYNHEVKRIHDHMFSHKRYLDSQGETWFYNNYIMYKLDTISSVGADTLKKHLFARDLLVHQVFEYRGKHWIATNKGMFAFRDNPNKKKNFLEITDSITVKNGLSSDFINTTTHGKNGELWIGTKEGLCQLKNGKIRQFSTKNGLISDNCTNLLIDHHGNLWIGTPKGLSHFNGKRFTNYDHKTGLASPNISCLYLDKQKRLWIGTWKGLSVLNIKQEPSIVAPPRFYLEKISSNGTPVQDTSDIELGYYDGLEVNFQALTFVHPEGIRYQYRIDSGPWKQTHLNFISYNRFTAGKHLLEIRAKKFNSSWSKTQAIRFEVKLPIWRRSWAVIGYLIVLALLMNLIIRRRSQKLEKEKLHLEKVVAERTHQLEQQKEEITLQAEKLKEMDQIKSRFFSNISHEFKTPLTLIIGPAEKILTDHKPKAAKTYAQYILANADRLMKLINQLMDISRMESGKMVLQTETGDLVAFLGQILQSFELLARQKAVQIDMQAAQEEIICDFDKDKIEKIFFNLLSNALKFTPEQGKVILKMEQQASKITITVSDTGAGISPEQLPYIFDRFYQVDSSKTRAYEGTGIGLSLVKELVDLHHGTINVKSKPTVGTEFKVVLPFTQSGVKHLTTSISTTSLQNIDSEIPDQQMSPSGTGQNTILVVEDNPELREFIVNELSNFYQVLEAKDGAEGIESGIKNIPDLIISDLMMPKVDGFELLQTLRGKTDTSHVPIIILSAKASFENRIAGLEKGGDDYLTKPFSPKELLLRVKNMLDRRDRMREMLVRSITQPNAPIETSPEMNSQEEAFLQNAVEIIERNLHNTTFDVAFFCKEIGMSQSSLFRKLKALTKMSIVEFIRSIKLKKAATLLTQKDHDTIEEIALKSGFNDISYFNKCFKKQYGVTPKEYNKN